MLMKWIKALRVYFNPRMLIMVGLGFSSGFPLLLVFSTLNLWLKDEGISYIAIGLFSLVKLPYSFKWLWAPLLDRLKLPGFGLLGRRRGWALFFQLLLMAGIALISTVDPAANLRLLAVLCVIVVIASASQDVVLDAYRIEFFPQRTRGRRRCLYHRLPHRHHCFRCRCHLDGLFHELEPSLPADGARHACRHSHHSALPRALQSRKIQRTVLQKFQRLYE